MQVYNDATVNGLTLSQSLFNLYGLGFTGSNFWTGGTGNFGDATWSLGHSPTPTEQAVLANGGTINVVTGDTVLSAQVASGTFNVTNGASLFVNTVFDLGPGSNAGSATLNLNGNGVLTVGSVTIDAGTTNGASAKQINFNGGTLVINANSSVSGSNLTTTVGANGAKIGVGGGATVTWGAALTPTAPGASLQKLGSGTLNLTNGGFLGPVSVSAGTLGVSGDVGTASATLQLGDAAVLGGDVATLNILRPATVLSPIAVGTASGAGTYTINVGTNATVAIPNAITMNQSLTISSVATTGTNVLTISGGITSTQAGNILTFNNTGRVDVVTNGINDGTGTIAVVKNGAGLTTFQAANNYTGGTTVNAGVLYFNGPTTIGGTGQNVLVNAGGVAAAGTNFTYTNLTGTFLSRMDQSSQGTFALAANSAENFDFTVFPNAFLGAVTNVTYTGTLTPGNGSYKLGGGSGNLTLPNTNAITGGNSLIIGGNSGGTVTLLGTNDYTGDTTIRPGGTLAIPNGDRISPQNITIDGGTLSVIGTSAATIPQPIIFTANNATLRVDNPAGATYTGGFNASAMTANSRLFKTGTGTANIVTALDLGPGVPLFNEGTVVFSGTSSLNTTNFFSIGQGLGHNATVIFQGSSTATVGTDFNVSDTQNSIGKMFVRDNARITTRTLYVGKNGNLAAGLASEGSLLQTGGLVTNGAAVGDWRIGGGGGSGDQNAVGSYTLAGGTMSTTANFQVGANGRGVMTITGGSASTPGGFPSIGRFATSYGVMTVSDAGVFNQSNTGNALIVGEGGIGRLNVLSGGNVNVQGTAVRVAQNANSSGFVNLVTGGTLNAPMITGGLGSSTLTFNGGTFKSTASNAASITALTNVYVQSAGGIIDTSLGNVSINSPIKAPTGSGLASVALTGSGSNYVAHPLVEITGGGGSGASAIALLNASGQVTGIQVTNPGVGYTSNPTITLKGGGSTTPAALGTISLAPTSAGTLTKTGAGVLTIGSVGSTFNGPTVVSQGTLRLSAATVPAVAVWDADTVTGANGDPVSVWTDSIGAKQATQNGANAVPTLALNSIGAHKALRFTGTSSTSLQVAAADSPISNAADFSIAVVFKTSTAGVGGEGQWWQNTGIVDSEEPGAQKDWGTVINANGRFGAGIGNPDTTVYSQTGMANGSAHVAVMTRSGNGPFSLTVDGQTVGAIGATTTRDAFRFLIGGIQTNANYFTGDIAQIQMYNTVLNPLQINTLGASLSSTYGLTNAFGGTTIMPNSPITVNGGALLDAASRQTVKSLTVNTGGSAVVSAGVLTVGDNTGAAPLTLGAGTPAGKLDLKNNGLIVDTAPGSDTAALTEVRSQIIKAYNASSPGAGDGQWNGNGGITSSNAAADFNSKGVGYALASDILGAGGGTFMGSTADGSAVLARYTLLGDATLDGQVNFNDLVQLAQSYNIVDGSRTWFTGDFTYDGKTDFNDLVKLAQNYNTALPTEPIPGAPANFQADLAAAFASVPEPGALSLLGLAACGFAGRRRRSRR
jgi:autotransporter-associated beta strand protein/T5SS/PEP-CTERM-associated repeat protein